MSNKPNYSTAMTSERPRSTLTPPTLSRPTSVNGNAEVHKTKVVPDTAEKVSESKHSLRSSKTFHNYKTLPSPTSTNNEPTRSVSVAYNRNNSVTKKYTMPSAKMRQSQFSQAPRASFSVLEDDYGDIDREPGDIQNASVRSESSLPSPLDTTDQSASRPVRPNLTPKILVEPSLNPSPPTITSPSVKSPTKSKGSSKSNWLVRWLARQVKGDERTSMPSANLPVGVLGFDANKMNQHSNKPLSAETLHKISIVTSEFEGVLQCYREVSFKKKFTGNPNTFDDTSPGTKEDASFEEANALKWQKIAIYLKCLGEKLTNGGSQAELDSALNEIRRASVPFIHDSEGSSSTLTSPNEDEVDLGNGKPRSQTDTQHRTSNVNSADHQVTAQPRFDFFHSQPNLRDSNQGDISPALARRILENGKARKSQWKADITQLHKRMRNLPQPEEYEMFEREVRPMLQRCGLRSWDGVSLLYYLTGKLLRWHYQQHSFLYMSSFDSDPQKWQAYVSHRIDFSLRFFRNHMAEWVAKKGGFETLLSKDSDSDLD